VIKIRDRPLRPPSPPPVIPRWKLIRPRPDVLQQLEDMERSKIPDRWCYIRSALKISSSDEDEDHKSASAIDCGNIKSCNECDWMRIEDIVQFRASNGIFDTQKIRQKTQLWPNIEILFKNLNLRKFWFMFKLTIFTIFLICVQNCDVELLFFPKFLLSKIGIFKNHNLPLILSSGLVRILSNPFVSPNQ